MPADALAHVVLDSQATWGVGEREVRMGTDGRVASTGVDGTLRPELADVGRLLRRGVRKLVREARKTAPVTVSQLIREHLGVDPINVEVVSESWPGYDAVNVDAGLTAWLARDPAVSHELIGLPGNVDLGLLVASGGRGPGPVNVSRVNLPIGPDGEVRACVLHGVYLIREPDRRTVVVLQVDHMVTVQVASSDPGYPAEVTAALRRAALDHNVHRGHVLSFGNQVFGDRQAMLTFHRRPVMSEDELILPPGILDVLRRQVVDVAKHKDRLRAAGQHLKRGVLLYGPPGVGKTHTVRYLMANLPAVTVIQLTGRALGMIDQACSVARALQPSMIIVEDVDLIADQRGMHPGQHPVLFQLLNEMDGLAEDADVVFVLTTNRVDLLEPALAQRPGRVDQAVELTLPDLSARRQLFELYRGGLDVETTGLDDTLDRTDGVTASFIKELLRRAALISAEQTGDHDDSLRVSAQDLSAAADELLDTRNSMTRALLGSTTPNSGAALEDLHRPSKPRSLP
jgi:ATPase family associated with various cellular activities (AAA)